MRLHRHDDLVKEVHKAIYRCGGVGLVSSERYATAARVHAETGEKG